MNEQEAYAPHHSPEPNFLAINKLEQISDYTKVLVKSPHHLP